MSCGCGGNCGGGCGCNKPCNYFCYPLNVQATRNTIIKSASQYLGNSDTVYTNNDGMVKLTAFGEKLNSVFNDVFVELLEEYPWCFLKNTAFFSREKFKKFFDKGLLQSAEYDDFGFRQKAFLYDGKYVFIEEEDFIATMPRYFIATVEFALADRMAIKPIGDLTRKQALYAEFVRQFKKAQRIDQEWERRGCFKVNYCCDGRGSHGSNYG